MANSPGNSEPIRCGMCGKPNPPERATCEFCGARLRPMTAEELGLSPAVPTAPLRWPEERKKPEPPKETPSDNPDDPLAGLRAQLADADDATIIGPSASKDRIKRQDLFENIEPDFTIGKAPEPTPLVEEDDDTAVPGDIPEWLREATKPGQTGPLQAPSGDMPDWLMEETRPAPPPAPLSSDEAFDIPDWLNKSGDELEDTSRSQATRPMPLADGTPEWMRDLDEPDEESPQAGVPDWLIDENAAATQPASLEEDLDWLRAVPASEEPEELELDVPDWLQSAGEPAAAEEAPIATPYEEDLSWMRPAESSESEPEVSSEGVPDWLSEMGGSASAPVESEPEEPISDAGVPDWLAEMGGTPSASVEAEPEEAISDEEPSWLTEMGGEPPAPAESVPASMEDEIGKAEPVELSVPDWLSEASKPSSELDDEAPSPLIASGMPDWLIGAMSEPQDAPVQTPEEPAVEFETPDWLRPPQDEAVEAETPEPVAEAETPDWLRPPDEMQPIAESSESAEPRAELETPDWLRAPDESVDEDIPAPAEVTPEVPAWLSGLGLGAVEESEETPAIEGASQPEASEPELDIEVGVPDWLAEINQPSFDATELESLTEPDIEAEAETPTLPEAPEWLAGLGGEPAAPTTEVEEEISAASEPAPEVPEWLAGLGGEPTAPATEVEEETSAISEVTPEVPEWLAGLGGEPAVPTTEVEEETPAVSEAALEVPAWLAGLGGEPVTQSAEVEQTPATSETAPEMPSWLAGLGGESTAPSTDVEEETSAISEAGPEVPAWLSGLGGEPAAPSAEMEAENGAEAASEVPEWLAGLGGEPAAPSAEVEEASAVSEVAPEVPDWLSGLGGESTAPSAEVESEASPEVPSWLSGLVSEPTEPTVASEPEVPAIAESEPEVPAWLSGVGSEQAAPSPISEPEAPTIPQAEETPAWLADITGETAAPATPAPVTQPLEPQLDEAPDWLSGIDSQPAPQDTEPDWLSDITGASPTPAVASPAGAGGTPDWLADLDEVLGMPSASTAPMPSMGEDLLGFDDFEIPTETPEQALEPDSGNLPEWLRDVAPETSSRDVHRLPDMPSDVPAELAGLRFEAITGQHSMEPTTEKVGALKDVTGVIRPEIIFDAQTLQVGKLVDELVVTNDQRKRIDALEALLERQARGVVVAETRATFPIVRWVIAGLLLFVSLGAALMAATGTSFLPDPVANTPHEHVADIINQLPVEQSVFIAFEYEPDTAAEMHPLAVALLDQLAGRSLRVYAISTRPAGPAMAQNAFNEASANTVPANWVNLGYLTGGAKGISALMIGNLPGVISPMEFDYQGEPTGLTATRLSDLNPSLLIVVSSRWEDLRAWVEQAKGVNQIVAATSMGTGPLAYPYTRSGQIQEVLSGVNDAVAYRAAGDGERSQAVDAAWNGQALGGLTAALLIIGGSIVYGLRALRQQQEQE